MSAAMCAEHRCPTRECEGVELTRARYAAVCLCAHPKAVHQHWRPGTDCGKCDCRSYETARRVRAVAVASWAVIAVGLGGFWIAVGLGVRAVIGR